MNSQRMRYHYLTGILVFLYLLIAAVLYPMWFPARAQEKAPKLGESGKKSSDGVIFKSPDGYMPLDYEKFKGVLMLDPKRPKGMFIAYPDGGQSTEDLSKLIHSSISRMFFHDENLELKWTTSALPAHEGVTDESGTLSLAGDEKQEIQVAAYTRTLGGSQFMYGYFAMRSKTGKEKESKGIFLDETGKGIKDFDKFWRSIKKGQ